MKEAYERTNLENRNSETNVKYYSKLIENGKIENIISDREVFL